MRKYQLKRAHITEAFKTSIIGEIICLDHYRNVFLTICAYVYEFELFCGEVPNRSN